MHSHSFQDTELKLHRYVNDSPGQVVEGLTILCYPRWLRNKGLIPQKMLIQHAFAQFSRYRAETLQVVEWLTIHGHSFQDIELKLHRQIHDSPVRVVEGLTILCYPRWLRNKGLIPQKTLI